MAKKILALFACVLVLLCASCRKNDNGVVEKISKIALITDVRDLEEDYENQAIWEGIGSCAESNGIEYTYYTPQEDSEQGLYSAFEKAVSEGASMVVCNGEKFSSCVKKMQEEHKNVRVIAIEPSTDVIGELKENVHVIQFAKEQAGYLAGYSCVMDGFTKLGCFADESLRYSNGFIQGVNDAALSSGKVIEIVSAKASDYSSYEEMTACIEKWFNDGTELVFAYGDDGFIKDCARIATQHMGYMVGCDYDQSALGTSYDYNPFMTSAMKGYKEAIDATLEMVLGGNWKESLGGKTIEFDLQNGNYLYLPENQWLWLFNNFSLDDYNAVKESISSGKKQVLKDTYGALDSNNVKFKVYE